MPFKISVQKREGLSNIEKRGFDFSVIYQNEEWSKPKSVSLGFQIKQSELKVFHSKGPSSDYLIKL